MGSTAAEPTAADATDESSAGPKPEPSAAPEPLAAGEATVAISVEALRAAMGGESEAHRDQPREDRDEQQADQQVEQADEPASGATAPEPLAEEVTNVIPRLRGVTRRPIAPQRYPAPNPAPNQSQPPRPAPAPRRPSPGQVPGQPFPPPRRPVPNQLGPVLGPSAPVNPNPLVNPGPPNQGARPPIGPPRRWSAATPRPGRPPVRLPIQPPGVPPVSLPPTPMVNRVIGPLQPAEETPAEPSALKKASDALSMSKVLAGGMAAATSAVFGSYFGTFGTVGGAAAGSVATTLVTRFYQRSLEHTRDLAKARVLSVGGKAEDEPVEEQRTVQLDPEKAAPASSGGNGHRSVKLLVSGTLVIFLIGLALVTGIEWAKGSPLSGGPSGTSVGRIVDPHPAPRPTPTPMPSERERSSSESNSDDEDSEDSSSDSSKHEKKKHLEDILPSDSDSPDPSDSVAPSAPPSSQPGLLPGLGKRQSGGGDLFQQPSSTSQPEQ
ncbi:MAG TPA: hypothetical protein VH141_21775 [Pseudonocardia sp.]|nr:hypothetical protein [Pseudonocardia sp.]